MTVPKAVNGLLEHDSYPEPSSNPGGFGGSPFDDSIVIRSRPTQSKLLMVRNVSNDNVPGEILIAWKSSMSGRVSVTQPFPRIALEVVSTSHY